MGLLWEQSNTLLVNRDCVDCCFRIQLFELLSNVFSINLSIVAMNGTK